MARGPDRRRQQGVAHGLSRVGRAWRALSREQRWCALAALALLLFMFLPWYSTTAPLGAIIRGRLQVAATHDSQTAIEAFTFVEAAILLVAAGVVVLLFARAERRAFHLPGGDGTVIAAAGAWAVLLIFWRFFDKPELGVGVSVGLRWGIFLALGAAIGLAYAGNRLRLAHRPEPPLPVSEELPPAERAAAGEPPLHQSDATAVIADNSPRRAATQRLFPVEGDTERHVPSLFPAPEKPEDPPPPPDELQ